MRPNNWRMLVAILPSCMLAFACNEGGMPESQEVRTGNVSSELAGGSDGGVVINPGRKFGDPTPGVLKSVTEVQAIGQQPLSGSVTLKSGGVR